MIFTTISLLLFTLYALLLLLYSIGWHRYNKKENNTHSITFNQITIIIPARNEADNIGTCLKSILNNDYPSNCLEIIVIDDFSDDATAAIAQTYAAKGNVKVLQLKDYLSKEQRLNSYKKKALEIAINASTGNWIITTDADCIVTEHWLKEMNNAMNNDATQFIAAPVSFIPVNKKNWLYYFQSLDFMTMQGITAASIKNNMGNMCNGANLAFRKTVFFEVDGYQGIDQIASGDDMLLMHKIQTHYPNGIYYLKAAKAIVQTAVQPDGRSFLNQRIRWSSKADKYNDKKLTGILAIVYFFNLNFLPLLMAALFSSKFGILLVAVLLGKIIFEIIFLVPVARFYNKLNEILYFVFLQPFHILYIISAGFLGKFGSYQWKGRTVK